MAVKAAPKKVVQSVRSAPLSSPVTGAKARAIAVSEPTSAKVRPGKTKKPLAPERVAAILDALAKTYPGVVCALNHRNAWELTIATILSAQCTDVRVNLVTPDLFKTFPTPKAMANASLPELEELIRTTGFFRNKAKSIQGASRVIVEEFGNKVPQTIDGSEDRQCCAGVVVRDRRWRGGGHPCSAAVEAAGANEAHGGAAGGTGSREDTAARPVDRVFA
jgi:hypothetical protein